MSDFEQYMHHNQEVWVRSSIKGKHREFCLCFSCDHYHMNNSRKNCEIANANFRNCVKYNTVQPIFECPKFEEKK